MGKTRQPPSARVTRFTHSTARRCIATQTSESPATATVLAAPTPAIQCLLSTRRLDLLYSQNVADEMGGHDGAQFLTCRGEERHLRLLAV
jgi:hypothetical protein